MTEPPELPPPETRDEPAPLLPPRRVSKWDLLPWLAAAGFLVLTAALVWVWLHRPDQPPAVAEAGAEAEQFGALEARVARLEQRPVPPTPDLGPLTARLSALEQRPAATSSASGQTVNLAPLEARIAGLEAKQQADSQLAGRIDALSARADSLETAQRAGQNDLARRLEADEVRLAAIERSTSQIPALADRAGRLARVQAIRLALDSGQKLGEIPGAPAPLARFANTAPPTEPGLRLAFPQAAREALSVARPASDGKPLLARVWDEAQDLVTVRQGDRVLVGDPAAGVLARARTALDAGDLSGAVAAVASLNGAPAQAMAGWVAEARALLDARAALAEWAAHA
jgi:hypothetical protein